jgi:hypothetical protein
MGVIVGHGYGSGMGMDVTTLSKGCDYEGIQFHAFDLKF